MQHSLKVKSMPSGVPAIYALVALERFSFYGLRALLFVFLLEQLFIDAREALEIYGSFIALHFATPLLGGWIGDHYLGNQRFIFVSCLIMALGFLGVYGNDLPTFFMGLGGVVLGSGCLRANTLALLGKLFPKNSHLRDTGFTRAHIFSNVCVVLGPIICGVVQEIWGWNAAFSLMAGVTLLMLVVLHYGRTAFGYHGLEPTATMDAQKASSLSVLKIFFYIALICAIPAFGFLVWQNEWLGILLPILSAFSIFMLGYICIANGALKKIGGILYLMTFNIGFLALFEQAKAHLLLFVNTNADRSFDSLFGASLGHYFLQYHEVPLSFFRFLNGLFVVGLGIFFAWYWKHLSMRKKNPIAPVKFGIGLILAALAFALMAFSHNFSSSEGYVSLWWVIGSYFFYAAGELCILPIGLSAITKLAPRGQTTIVVSAWIVSSTIGLWLSKGLGVLMTTVEPAYDTLCTLTSYCSNFGVLAWISLGMGMIALFASPFLRHLFQDEK